MSGKLTSVSGLRCLGFEGYRTVASLRDEGLRDIPEKKGVYLVIRTNNTHPRFLKVGTGGCFNGKDPNVCLSRLEREWVEDALVLYVGQTGTLRERIRELIRFGEGNPVRHHGGRLIWQLDDSDALMVCWKTVQNEDPRNVKKELIQDFKKYHEGRRPFANLKN